MRMQERAGDDRSDPLIDKWEDKVVDLTLDFEDSRAQYLQVYVSNAAAASEWVWWGGQRVSAVGWAAIASWCGLAANERV